MNSSQILMYFLLHQNPFLSSLVNYPQIFGVFLLYLIHYYLREEYDREIIMAEDGGTLGVDWAYCNDTRIGRPSTGQKPILLMSPGMGGKIY